MNPPVQKEYSSRVQFDERNVNYTKRHCEVCAKSFDAGLMGTPQDCPLRGTFHGKEVRIFQQNKLFTVLMKKGILSPYFAKIPLVLGMWKKSVNVSNLVTSAGKALIAGRINGSGAPAAATYIAVGTGTNAAAAGDTTLQTESSTSGLSRASATVSLVTTSVTNDTAQMQLTFTVTGSVAVTESGVLNASSTGTLLCRQVFSAINVVNGDSLQVTWKVQAS